MKIWKKFYECDCMSEGIMLSYEIDDPYPVIDLAFFYHGFHGKHMLTFGQRLKYMWQIFTKGTVWKDMVILTQEQAKALGTDLLEFSEKEINNGHK